MDLSSFAKYELKGRAAHSYLNRLCANRIPIFEGGVALVHMLTELGDIECEGTLTLLGEDHYYFLSAAVAKLHDEDWLTQNLLPDEDLKVENVTSDFGVLVLSGPCLRDIISRLASSDLSNQGFPWMRCRKIEVGGIQVRALRV